MGSGSKHRLTGSGELHRKPILFVFGREFALIFRRANKRTQKAQEWRPRRAQGQGTRRADGRLGQLLTTNRPAPFCLVLHLFYFSVFFNLARDCPSKGTTIASSTIGSVVRRSLSPRELIDKAVFKQVSRLGFWTGFSRV